MFIVDLNLKLKKNLLLNKLLKKRRTFLITNIKNKKKSYMFKKKGFKIIFVNDLKNKKDFYQLFKRIYKMGYSRIFIESGLTFINTLLKNELINDMYIFKNINNLYKNGKNNDSIKYLKSISSKPISINLNNDKLYKKEFYNV